MNTFELRLREGIDVARCAETYARDGVVQVPDLFEPQSADAIAQLLERATPWRLAYADPQTGLPRMLTEAQLAAMGPSAQEALSATIAEQARRNIGYAYNVYPLIIAYLERWDPGHPIHRITEFLNSRPFLDLGGRIIGVPGVTKTEAAATLYSPGHFLTRHVDLGDENERRCAFTIGFSRVWEPDWGGLLVFLDDKRDIARGLTPRFNTLTLFRQDMIHSVTQVSSFAGAGRYMLSGWLRDDPPFRRPG